MPQAHKAPASSYTWLVLRGLDFGPHMQDRYEPGDRLTKKLPADVAEDLQNRGAIQLVSGPDSGADDDKE